MPPKAKMATVSTKTAFIGIAFSVHEWAGYAPSKDKGPLKRGALVTRIGRGLSSAHHAPQFEYESLAHQIDCRGGRHP